MDGAELNALFGRNVRRRRRAVRLTQEAFAEKCGLHRAYIGAVERGERNVTLGTIARIAKALDTVPSDLLRSD